MPPTLNQDVIVLAGGFGTRLRTVVSDVPKPMAPIGGVPFLDYLLKSLANHGATRVILSTGHMAEAIENRYTGRFCGIEVTCVHEDTPLGTGGALRKALGAVRTRWALALNGDTWLDMAYGDFLSKAASSDASLAMATRYVDDTQRYGRCTIADGRVIGFGEKHLDGPGFINAGVYALRNDVFARFSMPEAFSFESDFIGRHLSDLSPIAYPTSGYFIDIGVPEDYVRAQAELPNQIRRHRSCP